MQITSPPRLGDIQSDKKWTVVCSICWHWSSGENKKQAREQLRHHVRCKYISVDEDRVKEIRPKNIR
ncbi:hypothetical protein [Candidatus Nitrosotalea bavarica]|uniref:hypothetical protein n=1 Tax=Candidatus Nitrosotalea bavarica TaxID=1903277 RepID=UPI000C70007C|nr:hypothetical protein [Candidatus Nitrosotalea bavarica]